MRRAKPDDVNSGSNPLSFYFFSIKLSYIVNILYTKLKVFNSYGILFWIDDELKFPNSVLIKLCE
ncbi:MAG: hypothetical protein LBM96_01045 [Methanobrevibacter sp.]|nr:hypothetical protein [Candidatus Methanoflexus mossambicus]